MRFSVLFLSGILAESCQKRADKARDEAEDLKRNAIMTRYECMRTKTLDKWDSINENTQKALIEMIHTSQNYGKLDAEFCHRIKNNYAPFGLADAKPARLDCEVIELKPFECPEDDHYNPECEKGEVEHGLQQPVYEIEGKRVPNIVILGQTGAGKSYFSNGLMGYTNPDIGPFGTGDSSVSCTRKPQGFHVNFYNNTLNQYGVHPMKMNIFDTPGFGDSDTCQIEANKQRIANEISKKIDVFAYLVKHDNPRFDASTQKTFRMLNEWTMGTIWNNFVIIYSRVAFDEYSRDSRYSKETTWKSVMKEKRNELVQNLFKMSQNENWEILNTTDSKTRKMVKEDFENIRTSALNVNQNLKCDISSDGIPINPSDHCWKLAKFNENQDYDIEVEPKLVMEDCLILPNLTEQKQCLKKVIDQFGTPSESIKLHENRFVLGEEALQFQIIVQEFMNHPVTPQKLFWEEKMKEDLKEYRNRWSDFQNLTDTEVVTLGSDNVDTSECEKTYNQTLNEIGTEEIVCPMWSKWIFEDCTKCGIDFTKGTRKCLKAGQELSSTKECEDEYPLDSRSETSEACLNLKPCKWLVDDGTDRFGWRKAGECSEKCGTGIQTYRRQCGGSLCEGDNWEQRKCNTHYCEYGNWFDVGICSQPCGGGQRSQNRLCIGKKCNPYDKTSRFTECNSQACTWSSWTESGTCSKLCGGGRQKYSRYCIDGTKCKGDREKWTYCNTDVCKVLKVVEATTDYRIWHDAGSGARLDGSFWTSHFGQSFGFKRLGDRACRGHNKCGQLLMVKDISSNRDALKRPTGSTKLWSDRGSGADHDVTIYRLDPPYGYTCLGYVAMGHYNGGPNLDEYACVKNEYLLNTHFGK
jgi:GTPase SAR1 family protein